MVGQALAVLLDGLAGISAVAMDPSDVTSAVETGGVDVVVVPVDDDVPGGQTLASDLAAARPGADIVLLVPPPARLWERIAASAGWRVVSLDDDPPAIAWAVSASGRGARRATSRTPPPPGDLTPREIEVLRSLAVGLRPEDISTSLGVSPHTVRSHIRNVISKLGVRSRLEAVAEGRKAGYLTGEPHPQSGAASEGSR
jgi:DNA-binding CsgD family transcriptional regulator